MKKRIMALALSLCLFMALPFSARAADDNGLSDKAFTVQIYTLDTGGGGVYHQMQGACTDGRYIWGGWNNRRIITRLDTFTGELQTKTFSEEDWMCGHINDMAYNPNTNKVYIVCYDPADWSTRGDVAVFDPITLEFEWMIKLKYPSGEMVPINSMVYDRTRNRYVVSLASQDGEHNVILDEHFNYVAPFSLDRAEELVLQGFDTDGTYIYRAVWEKNTGNFISVYDMDGRFITQIDTGLSPKDMELEDVMCDWNGSLFLNCTRRDGRGGNFYYTQLWPDKDLSRLENILGRIAAPIDCTL